MFFWHLGSTRTGSPVRYDRYRPPMRIASPKRHPTNMVLDSRTHDFCLGRQSGMVISVVDSRMKLNTHVSRTG